MTRVGLTQRVVEVLEYRERRDALDQRWIEVIERLGAVPVPIGNRTADTGRFVAELGLDAVILTGGNDLANQPGAQNTAPERDRLEFAILSLCVARSLPVFGVCRGLQIANVFFGGRLERIEGHVGSPHEVRRADGAELSKRVVNSFHGFGISDRGLAPELDATWHAPCGWVEGARHRDAPFEGVMWHPERMPMTEENLFELHRFLAR